MWDKIDATQEAVASWLESNGNYTDSISVFESGNKEDIQALLTVYNAPEYALV